MKLKEAKTIELTYEQIDSIVLQELKNIYEQQLEEIYRVQKADGLQPYQLADIEYAKQLLAATRVLIEYHMPPFDADLYFDSMQCNDDI